MLADDVPATGGAGYGERWGTRPSAPPSPVGGPEAFGYDELARNLIGVAVTTERVAAVIAGIAGDRIEVGPLHFGPRGTVSATGVGVIGPVRVDRRLGGSIAFDATIPGELTIDLSAGQHRYRYEGDAVVPLKITAQPAPPAILMLSVAPIDAADVTVRLRTAGLATFVLQTIGDADTEVAAQVAEVVNARARAVADLCRIDLASLLAEAWDRDLQARLAALRDR